MARANQLIDGSVTDVLVDYGAQWETVNGKPVAVAYGNVSGEYEALVNGAGIADLSHTTRVMHTGGDALDLLNRLTTNDLGGLVVGHVATTVLTSEIGRVIDFFRVVRLEADRLLLISESLAPEPLVDNIDKYTILEEAVLENASPGTARIGILGPQAREVATSITGADISVVEAGGVQHVPAFDDGALILQGNPFRLDGCDVLLPIEEAPKVWEAAVEAGAVPVGRHALEQVRIKAGIPGSETELNDRVNPLEAGLEEFVSFTKGCYVGQEVIARLDTYDKVQRRLVRLDVPEGVGPGEALNSGSRTAGWVTSVSILPDNGRLAALGYVRKAFLQPGTVLSAGNSEVTVIASPSPSPVAR